MVPEGMLMLRVGRASVAALLVAVLLLACTATPVPKLRRSSSATAMSADARAYLTAALDVMQHHALNRARLNWTVISAASVAGSGRCCLPIGRVPGDPIDAGQPRRSLSFALGRAW
jgi:hypothetical protein